MTLIAAISELLTKNIKRHHLYFLLFIFFTSCKSETEKFNDSVKNQISTTLKENEKIIYFENIENDSLSQRQIENFVWNYAYDALVHFHKEQENIGSTIKDMDTAKTPEDIYTFQEDFKNKMKIVSDSFQFYNKIAEKVIDSKASEKKIVKVATYRMIIEDKITGYKKDKSFQTFIDGNKIFDNDAFFRFQVKKMDIQK